MRSRSLLVSLVGLAVAGSSVYFARAALQLPVSRAAVRPDAALVQVAVARADIPFGAAIEPQMVEMQKWPRDALPVGAFTNLSKIVPTLGGEPRRAKSPLSAGQILLASQVSNFGEKVTIVATLGQNARAMTISVDVVSGVGGFVTPGDRVDIIVLTKGNGSGMRAMTILQDIRVIGVDQMASENKDKPQVARTVTVEVTPEQGQRLALAQNVGKLSLTLRSVNDVHDAPLQETTLADLMQSDAAKGAPVRQERLIRVRRGSEKVETVDITN